jgi:hypothetical protein
MKASRNIPMDKNDELLSMLSSESPRYVELEELTNDLELELNDPYYEDVYSLGLPEVTPRNSPIGHLLDRAEWAKAANDLALQDFRVSSELDFNISHFIMVVESYTSKLTSEHLMLDEITDGITKLVGPRDEYWTLAARIAEKSIYEDESLATTAVSFEKLLQIIETDEAVSSRCLNLHNVEVSLNDVRGLIAVLDLSATLTE